MMRKWMASQAKTNERIKNQVVEIIYKPPFIRNENDKGDVAFIEEDGSEPILAMPNPSLINSNSPTVSPSLKDCTMHIPYTNVKTFTDVVLPNHVGDKELKSIDGVGTGRMTKKDDMRLPKEPNKEWKLKKKRFLMKKTFITIYGTQLKFPI
ncbi:hypothetical protein Tco_0251732 [Tanacetum coccineum]